MSIKSNICNICKKTYKSPQSLWNHKNKYHDNYTFLPQKNSLASQDSSNTTHLSSNYTIEKSFICEYCNKNYSRSDNLKYDELKELRENLYKQCIPILKDLISIDNNIEAIRTLMNIYGTIGDNTGYMEMKNLLEQQD